MVWVGNLTGRYKPVKRISACVKRNLARATWYVRMVGYMGKKYDHQERQVREMASRRRRQIAVYVGLGLLVVAAVAVSLYALA
ncbi:hypothetical protein SAMN04489740_1010 [Arthrobacter alpinus]|uniref:Uncharacterized protein n=1 Tax=Arthrobacter alpinus TaxID=656366 RepID=A0A1H5HH13_9MICC|nr:hypothetical protein SAMN04489740_1010 [Arthrobacter alpinus]